MSGVNKVILIGRVGQDPEMKDHNGLAICNFSMATSKEWKDDSGEKQEKTEWHRIVCFKQLAETCGKYLAKGKQVYLEGELQTRSWEDDAGVKKYMTEILARNVQFLSAVGEQADAPTESHKAAAPKQKKLKNFAPGADNTGIDEDEEIPF